MTSEEKHLWYDYLHDHPARFTKQKVLGNYIADFYSAQAKLVIEIDGSQHYTDDGLKYDEERTKCFEERGLNVLRIPNNEINNNFDGVCEYIDKSVKQAIK